jgi:hypothetical protein
MNGYMQNYVALKINFATTTFAVTANAAAIVSTTATATATASAPAAAITSTAPLTPALLKILYESKMTLR